MVRSDGGGRNRAVRAAHLASVCGRASPIATAGCREAANLTSELGATLGWGMCRLEVVLALLGAPCRDG